MADLGANDKLKQICDALRIETLKPAEEEAEVIVCNAKEQAKRIIQDAKEQAKEIILSAEDQASHKIKQGEAALALAGKRTLESLKQAVENTIFREALAEWLEQITIDPEFVAKLMEAMISAVEGQGITGSLSAYIGKHVSPRNVNELLGKSVTAKLRKKSLIIGNFSGGVQLKVEDKDWVLDLSSEALLELFLRYLQKDFREMIFQGS
ncbi:V-type ATP synthase subunit E [Chlamydia pecorum]|uniref:ATP synthase subunit n=1 Tax=Chlamydia pecorum (strain ATCC VR-628 / DSM 29919 / E58) TaxID=331635 RepID=A0AA34RDZ0_CHLPE|nr:V-type ATP synthase subunit E [Chlamydia pecorum]AEB41977.1 ATP synthase subunit [Chlamydia pecorum E58]AGW39057.1 V-type ATP synthase subunit E [Chlamydia pecorum W73]AGW39983.1 V-type ATP synthase subunit E [Chlamydia pecorum P787]UFP06592.1 V-type ATP synthase subunit E [Chlamydia pecorum]UJT77314.1 ATP synthase subunit [Chlamydia pecorum]